MTLKLWHQYKNIHMKRVADYKAQGIMNYISDDDEDSPTSFKMLRSLKSNSNNADSLQKGDTLNSKVPN